jgi:thiamine pyrophosphokinase
MTKPRVLIFANGHLPDLELARSLLRPGDFLLGADGGTRHILALGRTPDLVVGDMDSLEPEVTARLEKEGVKMFRYPRDKNETDLDLAIRHALELSPGAILIIAALGERLDQTIGNLALLTDVRLSTLDVRLDDGVEAAFFCRQQTRPEFDRRAEVRGRPGDIVSLIPWGGQVEGILTEGLRWPLRDETLLAHQTRGISNELEGGSARVSIRSGVLLIVHRRLS